MEPAGLALAVFGTLKEVYLLSKFVLKTVNSATHHTFEKGALILKFKHEFLFLRSFRFLLIGNNGMIVEEESLDHAWLCHIQELVEQIRGIYGDYAKLAAAHDEEYQKHSPYLPDAVITKNVDFDITLDFLDPVKITTPAQDPNARQPGAKPASSDVKNTSKPDRLGHLVQKISDFHFKDLDWQWALFQQRKLNDVLANLRVWTSMLKDLVPITLTRKTVATSMTLAVLNRQATKEDRVRLGLDPHAQLRQLTAGNDLADPGSFEITDFMLDAPEDPTSVLTKGVLWKKGDRDEIQELSTAVLVEYKPLDTSKKVEPASKPFNQLANLLRSSGNSDLRTLPFKGFREEAENGRYAYIFNYPEHCRETIPVSLHDVIASTSSVDFSLEVRFKVAQTIAKCIWTLHTDEWVHKSVRSQSIVFFGGDHNKIMYTEPYLVDFAFSRPLGNQSSYTYDDDTERNLYRHPDRQGPPRATFTKIYDIYALGVVLLEIGLCQTAASIRDEAKSRLDPVARASFVPKDLMQAYVAHATSVLPRSMGISYRDAVLTCLKGDFESKANGSGFGMEFYQSVVQALDIRKLVQV